MQRKNSGCLKTLIMLIFISVAFGISLTLAPFDSTLNYSINENKLCIIGSPSINTTYNMVNHSSTIKVKIRNLTEQAQQNITITFYVSTNDGKYNTTLVRVIPSIEAQKEYTINYTAATTRDYESVTKVTAKIGVAPAFEIKDDVEFKDYRFTFIFVFVLVLIYLFVGYFIKQKQIKTKKVIIEQEEQEVIKEQDLLAKQIKLKELEIEELRLKTELENEKIKQIECTFCGNLNDKTEKNCTACGAKLIK